MILVDTNVFMYAAGAPHPNKEPCVRLVERIAREEVDAAVDVEVLQEILHRYRAIGRWQDGRRVHDLTRRIVPQVIDVSADMLDQARAILDEADAITARDAVHAAVCLETGAEAICSYDRRFDHIPAITRVDPTDL